MDLTATLVASLFVSLIIMFVFVWGALLPVVGLLYLGGYIQ